MLAYEKCWLVAYSRGGKYIWQRRKGWRVNIKCTDIFRNIEQADISFKISDSLQKSVFRLVVPSRNDIIGIFLALILCVRKHYEQTCFTLLNRTLYWELYLESKYKVDGLTEVCSVFVECVAQRCVSSSSSWNLKGWWVLHGVFLHKLFRFLHTRTWSCRKCKGK